MGIGMRGQRRWDGEGAVTCDGDLLRVDLVTWIPSTQVNYISIHMSPFQLVQD